MHILRYLSTLLASDSNILIVRLTCSFHLSLYVTKRGCNAFRLENINVLPIYFVRRDSVRRESLLAGKLMMIQWCLTGQWTLEKILK